MQRFQNDQITSNGNHNIARRVIWKLKGMATKNSFYNNQRVTSLYVSAVLPENQPSEIPF